MALLLKIITKLRYPNDIYILGPSSVDVAGEQGCETASGFVISSGKQNSHSLFENGVGSNSFCKTKLTPNKSTLWCLIDVPPPR